MIMTVRGPIEPGEFGPSLPHEHILVDFGGAATASPHRYDTNSVIGLMRPFLSDLVDQGVHGFVDCTPMYLARDVRILRQLSELTGLHIVTNTGQYKKPFLPERTFQVSPAELAAEWVSEWTDGIDRTDIRPGFIKTAVEPESLSDIEKKVIEAAGITSRETGLTIGTHTCAAVPALEILDLLDRIGVKPAKWIFIHAQAEQDRGALREVAGSGCWIEVDSVGNDPDDRLLELVLMLLGWGCEKRLLLSHDAGWYTVGEPGGGKPRPYTHLFSTFIPILRQAGVSDSVIRQITVDNPAAAFTAGETASRHGTLSQG